MHAIRFSFIDHLRTNDDRPATQSEFVSAIAIAFFQSGSGGAPANKSVTEPKTTDARRITAFGCRLMSAGSGRVYGARFSRIHRTICSPQPIQQSKHTRVY